MDDRSLKELLKLCEHSMMARIELVKIYVLERKNLKIELEPANLDSRLFEVAFLNAKNYYMKKLGSMTILDRFGRFIKNIF